MKILYVYSDINCSCTRINTFELRKGYKKIGNPVDVVYFGNLRESHFQFYDVIFFQRLGGNGVVVRDEYIERFKMWADNHRDSTLIVYTIDDLLIGSAIYKFIEMADLVIVPNPTYEKYYGKYNDNFEYFKTFVDIESIIKIPKSKDYKKDKFNIMWASTGLLGKNFMENLLPAIEEEFPNSIINIMGYGSNNYRHKKNYRVFPILGFEDFISYFKTADVVLNPISVDQPVFRGVAMEDFINCKSEIKYLTAGLCRVPLITSKSYCYRRSVRNADNGFILDNNVSEWIDILKKIKTNTILRNTVIDNAYKDVTQNYNLKVTAQNFIRIFQNHYNQLGKGKKVKSVKKPEIFEEPITLLPSHGLKIDHNQHSSTSILGEIFSNRTINQNIKCTLDNFCRIDFKSATYNRLSNKGTLMVIVLGEEFGQPKILRSCEVDISNLNDNDWFSVKFDPLKESKDKTFTIQIRGVNCAIGSSVSVYYDPNIQDLGQLYINKNKFKGNLTLRTFAKS